MELEFIRNLEEVVKKYPFPKIHKIIIYLILAMAKMAKDKNYRYYIPESISAISLVKNKIFNMEEIEGVNKDNFSKDIGKIFEVIIILPDFEKIDVITKYCMEILPAGNDDYFENFFKKRFG